LSDCTAPLWDFIDDLVKSGQRTAKEHYGCRGWVLNHNTDIWRGTAPINGIDGIWPTGAAWLCQHLWEHYQFTGDKIFLAQRAYPAMKEASLFFMDFLVKDPKTGWLVSCPSYSPEQGNLCAGPTMDQQLIRALMDHTLQAAAILHTDADFCAGLAKIRAQVSPDQVGKEGQLQEWLTDIDKPNNNHRHMSPLWGLFPGDEITPDDPKIFDAAKVLLKWRGDGSTGWSYAWRIPLLARIGDGDGAFKQFATMLDRKTLPSMLDLCGPFQIDGNFGAPAGIAEMLLQSHLHTPGKLGTPDVPIIDLLPALPKAWPTGTVTGLCARGGFQIDLAWNNNTLKSATLHSNLGTPCQLRYGSTTINLSTTPGQSISFDNHLKTK
ncbi:MAG TPA: glycoside hydrolase family 95 protein, partial [Phycisphaerae bacterium]